MPHRAWKCFVVLADHYISVQTLRDSVAEAVFPPMARLWVCGDDRIARIASAVFDGLTKVTGPASVAEPVRREHTMLTYELF